MAHFAKIENGYVTEVIVINNDVILDESGNESEAIGAEFCQNLFGGEWVQTSYNKKFRGKFAGSGDFWDGKNFIPPVENVKE
jgi:hypothetical protein